MARHYSKGATSIRAVKAPDAAMQFWTDSERRYIANNPFPLVSTWHDSTWFLGFYLVPSTF